MKKSVSNKGRKSGFAGVRRKRLWKKYGGMVITISAIVILAVVGIWAIAATNKKTAEMSSQLATAIVQPTPTPTEVVVLDGITIAKVENEEEVQETPTEAPEVMEEAEEEGEEEVAEAEESEEAAEATPTATAQPTQATQQATQPTQGTQQQATVQPTQATQPVVTTATTSGNSWSWSYHNDNGQVTVSTSGDWPEGLDPNDPNSVYQWMLQNTGINPKSFQ